MGLSFLEMLQSLADSVISDPFWGVLAGSVFMCEIVMFGMTKRPANLVVAMAAMAFGGATMVEPGHFIGFWLPVAVVVAVLMLLGAGVWLHSELTTNAAPKPAAESAVDANALQPLVFWLRGIEDSLPAAAREKVCSIRAHLGALGERNDLGPLLINEMTRSVDDIRGLVVSFKRVEAAYKMLPGKSNVGDDLLIGGLTRIERSIVEKREEIAKAEEQQLQVQSHYLELKHEQPN